MSEPRRISRRTIVIGVVVAVALAVVVGPWVYINVIREAPPERLGFDEVTSTTGGEEASDEPLDGSWVVADGSIAGYRVAEVLFGQDTEAVGRTEDVTGELEVAGTTVPSATFTVDLSTVSSDDSRRDGQFRGRIMDVATFPEATFVLSEAIDLAELPPDGEEVTVTATGDLTLKGQTRAVTFELLARATGGRIEVNGSIPIVFADFGIANPSFGPAEVGDDGEIEVLLSFERA